MPLQLDIVTGERLVYSDTADEVIAPGTLGQLGILPRHASLLTTLQPGEMIIKKGGEEVALAVGGGFLEVHDDKVTVLADTAERAEELDAARAEAAMRRAQELLAERQAPEADLAQLAAAARRAQMRLKVARRRQRPGGAEQ